MRVSRSAAMPLGGSRREYQQIQGADRQAPSPYSAYGSLYQAAVEHTQGTHDGDPENPFSSTSVRITHRSAANSKKRGRSYLWWGIIPGLAVLIVAGVLVGYRKVQTFASARRSGTQAQGKGGSTEVLQSSAGGKNSSTAAVRTKKAHDDVELPSEAVLIWGLGKNGRVEDDRAVPEHDKNATHVFSCLEVHCNPLVSQLGKAWRDIANINLLRCLDNAASNRTEARVCFKAAGPSELRDDLLNCSGCSGCVKLNDQASVDRACEKYDAWSHNDIKQAPPATAADVWHLGTRKQGENEVVQAANEEKGQVVDAADEDAAQVAGVEGRSDGTADDAKHEERADAEGMPREDSLSWSPAGEGKRAKDTDDEVRQNDVSDGLAINEQGDRSLFHNLPARLWRKYCSQYWCA